jgi:DNA-binding NarL/FixJ family response regulator
MLDWSHLGIPPAGIIVYKGDVTIPYRIALADDDALFRPLMKRFLETGPGLEVACEACDGSHLLSLLGGFQKAPQMAILDVSMPNLGGIETTSRVKAAYPGLKVLIVSVHREPEYVREARSAGADGYVLKEDVDTELFPAIERIRSGGAYFSAHLDADDRRVI